MSPHSKTLYYVHTLTLSTGKHFYYVHTLTPSTNFCCKGKKYCWSESGPVLALVKYNSITQVKETALPLDCFGGGQRFIVVKTTGGSSLYWSLTKITFLCKLIPPVLELRHPTPHPTPNFTAK